MRRFAAWTTLALLLGLLGPGAIDAATINGTPGADTLRGTPNADTIAGAAGDDLLIGGGGRDAILGGAGNDRVVAQSDLARDTIRCGAGADIVTAGLEDSVAADCETVSRALGHDPGFDFDAQHETQVEPASASFGARVVTAYQTGRYLDGGASALGFATSANAGRTWHAGLLPQLTTFQTPAGDLDRVSDPSVVYDATHREWLVFALAEGEDEGASTIVASRSRDGLAWSRPVTALRSPTGVDKDWATCDNWPTSPFRGRCYLSYLDLRAGISTRHSDDGGLTWSAPTATPARLAAGQITNGAQPVVRQDGSVLVVFVAFGALFDARSDELLAARSTDGGATFEPARKIAQVIWNDVFGVRSAPLPSVTVDAGGTVSVAWADCRFRRDCTAVDSLVTRTRNGLDWTAPTPIVAGGERSNVDWFMPAIAADATRPGRLAAVFYSLAQEAGCNIVFTCPGADAWLATSTDGGGQWTAPRRLTAQALPLSWAAEADIGRFLGDYVAVSWAGGRAIPVYTLTAAPVAGELRQSVAAGRVAP